MKNKPYYLMLDHEGSEQRVELDAKTRDTAIAEVRESIREIATGWCSIGDWPIDGARVEVRYTVYELDEEIYQNTLMIDIEPDHAALIRDIVQAADFSSCGDDPDAHKWVPADEGCDENPGVWSLRGTAMMYRSYCSECGIRREEISTGEQYNCGDHDTTTYSEPETHLD